MRRKEVGSSFNKIEGSMTVSVEVAAAKSFVTFLFLRGFMRAELRCFVMSIERCF